MKFTFDQAFYFAYFIAFVIIGILLLLPIAVKCIFYLELLKTNLIVVLQMGWERWLGQKRGRRESPRLGGSEEMRVPFVLSV